MIWDLLLQESIYVALGVFAGLMAGILGIGGGVIIVPGLLLVFQTHQIIPQASLMHVAAGTSLAIMFFTSQASLRAHYRLGEILWPVFYKLVPGIVLGACTGSVVAQYLPTALLKIIFALFLLFVAYKLFANRHKIYEAHTPNIWFHRFISFLIGLKSGILGVGGGILVIPYLTWCGVPTRQIAPISNLCSFTIAFVGALIFMLTGLNEMAATPYTIGFLYWPAVLGVAIPSALVAPLGARLNYILPLKQLKYGFIVILLITAIKMLV